MVGHRLALLHVERTSSCCCCGHQGRVDTRDVLTLIFCEKCPAQGGAAGHSRCTAVTRRARRLVRLDRPLLLGSDSRPSGGLVTDTLHHGEVVFESLFYTKVASELPVAQVLSWRCFEGINTTCGDGCRYSQKNQSRATPRRFRGLGTV